MKKIKKIFLTAILKKDKEINLLKLKLSNFPFELIEGEKLITIDIIIEEESILFFVNFKDDNML